MNRFRGWLRLAAGGALLLLISLSAPASAQTPMPPPPPPLLMAFSEGQWMGLMMLSGTVAAPGGIVLTSNYEGTMDFSSAAGVLNGTFNAVGNTVMTGPEISGTGVITIPGVIQGPADTLDMLPSSMTIDGTVTAAGTTVSQAQTLGPGELENIRVILISGTCTGMFGDWETPASANIASGGASPSLIGSWYAWRTGDLMETDADAYREAVANLITDMTLFRLDSEIAGAVDFYRLNQLLIQAEDLDHALRRDDACGGAIAGSHTSLAADMVAQLIEFAIEHPELFTTQDLNRLITAGVRTGVIGAGATNPAYADSLEARLSGILNSRATLLSTSDSPDCTSGTLELTEIILAAIMLGDESLETYAAASISVICGGG